MKRFSTMLLSAALCLNLMACGQKEEAVQPPDTEDPAVQTWDGSLTIELSDDKILVDGAEAATDPASAVYIANDIVYYEEGKDFTYGEGTEADAHSAEEAAAHTVVRITQPGTYVLQGKLSAGQVAVDLGEDAEEDPNAVVTLVLNGVDITCTVAPAVIFYNVYECGSTDTETASKDVDTSAAGANVIIADGTENTVNGSYVARIYKPDSVELSEDGTEVLDAKKLHKYDAAFYSKMSMNVSGESSSVEGGSGVLNINAENEGLDSELHLTINGGDINIVSGNDGINTNEDGVSVTTINGGSVSIVVSGETGEGDGIDSNGWLVINGGTVTAAACNNSADSGIDSDMGIHINGGFVAASGHMLDRIEDGGQTYAVFTFAQTQKGGTEVTLKSADGDMATYTPANDYSILLVCDPFLEEGDYTLWQGEQQLAHGGAMGGGFRPGGMGMSGGTERPEPPEGMKFPEGLEPSELPEGMERPEEAVRPEGMEPPELNEDGTITLPDGTVIDPSQMQRPEGQGGGRGPGGMMGGGRPGMMGGAGETERSDVFAIQNGGNMFSGVSAAE
ncbi:MAG: carbohydrate-binding domain-containing protein [Oscillibacter sp.]|nr:carbohydrate-binding domain-containing protein [Oscillibacter sp.]